MEVQRLADRDEERDRPQGPRVRAVPTLLHELLWQQAPLRHPDERLTRYRHLGQERPAVGHSRRDR